MLTNRDIEDAAIFAKEYRKEAEAIQMAEDRHQKAAGWSPEEALSRAQQDIATYRQEINKFEQNYQIGDMAESASANPHYREALAQTAPELVKTVEERQVQQAELLATMKQQQVAHRNRAREAEMTARASPTPLIPARELPAISEKDIVSGLTNSALLSSKYSEIEKLAEIVYGTLGSVDKVTSTLHTADRSASPAAVIDQAVRQIQDDLKHSSEELAGKTRFGIDSADRKEARAQAPLLIDALQRYGRAVTFERATAIEQLQQDRQRQLREVPAPSADLLVALRAPAQERAEQLAENPSLAAELKGLTKALNGRLSPEDHRSIRRDDMTELCRSLNVHPQHAREVSTVQKQVRETNRIVEAQVKAQTRKAALTR